MCKYYVNFGNDFAKKVVIINYFPVFASTLML